MFPKPYLVMYTNGLLFITTGCSVLRWNWEILKVSFPNGKPKAFYLLSETIFLYYIHAVALIGLLIC